MIFKKIMKIHQPFFMAFILFGLFSFVNQNGLDERTTRLVSIFEANVSLICLTVALTLRLKN